MRGEQRARFGDEQSSAFVRLAAYCVVVSLAGCESAADREEAAKIVSANKRVDQLRRATSLYLDSNRDVDCPTVEQVFAEGSNARIDFKDPWGQPYVIKCDGENLIVLSKGPDTTEGTPDDLRTDRAH